jgi:hypothetical protein
MGMVTFHPQGHVDEGRHKVIRCNEKTKYPIKRRLKKINKGKFFFSWKKDNAVKVKFIWLTENTQGTGVENKTFENM